MDFETFRQLHKKLPFWKKLKWLCRSIESYQKAIADKEIGLRNGQSKDLIKHYEKERDGQFKRAEWLYSELLDMYEHERELRIRYQKLVQGR